MSIRRIVVASDQGITSEEKTCVFGAVLNTIIEDLDFDIEARHRFENEGGYIPEPPQPYFVTRTVRDEITHQEWLRLCIGTFYPPIGEEPKER